MTYGVIRFEKKYQQAIVDLILPIQQQEFNLPITIQDQPDLQDISSFYLKGKGNFWIALCGSQLVGTIGLIDIGNGQAVLRKMFVHLEHRGKEKGVAQLLFDTLAIWCHQKSAKEVFLGTIDSMLAAHRFYFKNGFLEIQKTELPDSFPVMRVDNRFFRCKIK
jgi:N-acetylglutamate synthase-like GNAT family acetyltransferase